MPKAKNDEAKNGEMINVRNIKRAVYYLHLDAESAKRARAAKVPGVHKERNYLVLGDAGGKPDKGDIASQIDIPLWLWNAARAYAGEEGKGVSQGKFIDGLVREGHVYITAQRLVA